MQALTNQRKDRFMATGNFNPLDIRAMRKMRGLTQTELGSLVGVKQVRIADIERAPESVSLGQYNQILRALGFHPEAREADWVAPPRNPRSFVYVLRHASLPLVKIGKANDVSVRSQYLGEVIAGGTSLSLPSERSALRIERILHRLFHQWRLSTADATSMGAASDGASEWFHSACHARLIEFIEGNADLLGYELGTT